MNDFQISRFKHQKHKLQSAIVYFGEAVELIFDTYINTYPNL